jgi:predicted permease
MKRLRRRLRYWCRHGERHSLLQEEMEFHLETLTQQFIARGMPEDEARTAARRKFGNMTQTSAEARATWIARWASDLLQDLRYAFRGMRRQTGFTAFVVLIAGLGIGASATVYSVVNTLLLRPPPYRDPAQLVWIWNRGLQGAEWSLQSDHFLDLKARTKSFSDMAGWSNFYAIGDSKLTGTGEPERLTSVPVTQNFFTLLGVPLALGRGFTDAECHAPFYTPPATILSDALWKREFAADPHILGRKLIINDAPVIVVGVLPASFDFGSVLAPGNNIDLFLPLPLTDEFNRRGNTMAAIGRLHTGITAAAAQAEFTILGQQLEAQYPRRNGIEPVLNPLEQHVSGRVRPALLVLACAVGVVMLIVCANLSSLQLARMTSRRREMAVRTALGAARHRLLRQALTESVALSFCGALLGLVLAFAGTHALARLSAFRLPLLAGVRLDGAAVGFTLLAAFLTGILFGLLPALEAPSLTAQDELKDNPRTASGSRAHTWIRNALVVSEIAFACVLLVSAGLLIRSFLRVLDLNLGFQPDRAYAIRIDPSSQYKTKEQRGGYFDDVLNRIKSIPGISEAGLTDVLPFDGDRSWGVAGKGQVYPKGHFPEAFVRMVSEGYTQAAGIPLKAGRMLTARDNAGSDNVVVINESLARTLWPGQNAVGQAIGQDRGRQVVGVVGDVRHHALEEAGGGEMYIPIRQTFDYDAVELVVRTALPADTAAKAVHQALRPVDPNMPLRDFRALRDLVDHVSSPRRFLVWLLGGFASFALLLASLGIYALISHSVSQRVQEIGIRMALGATAGHLQRVILRQILMLTAAGLVLGMIASRLIATLIGSMLFGVTAGDPATFAGMTALMILVALLAGFIPARRATRVDPMVALRVA